MVGCPHIDPKPPISCFREVAIGIKNLDFNRELAAHALYLASWMISRDEFIVADDPVDYPESDQEFAQFFSKAEGDELIDCCNQLVLACHGESALGSPEGLDLEARGDLIKAAIRAAAAALLQYVEDQGGITALIKLLFA